MLEQADFAENFVLQYIPALPVLSIFAGRFAGTGTKLHIRGGGNGAGRIYSCSLTAGAEGGSWVEARTGSNWRSDSQLLLIILYQVW